LVFMFSARKRRELWVAYAWWIKHETNY
jgi:hypothetical protein